MMRWVFVYSVLMVFGAVWTKNHHKHRNKLQLHELLEVDNYREDGDSQETQHHRLRHHHGETSLEIPWPVKKEAIVEGDLILGGLMMVHEREDSVTCGPVMPQGGIQALEAMLYTLDRLNDGVTIHRFLPNITLGAHILDDCDKDTYGLEMAVDFIK
ncbi:PREDICTED: metabotropic glutamate receptor 2-like, partial [Nicrophorus vespilloides]|uniref:Metabotropic glutamate receptor 2-like n=1 Tax=Nicrophorus vespilloides TaxID=110193 RepID=A0ABM1N0V7_NICVS